MLRIDFSPQIRAWSKWENARSWPDDGDGGECLWQPLLQQQGLWVLRGMQGLRHSLGTTEGLYHSMLLALVI